MTEPHLSDPRKAKVKHDYQTCLLIQKNMTKFLFVCGYSKFAQPERELLKLHLRVGPSKKGVQMSFYCRLPSTVWKTSITFGILFEVKDTRSS